MKHPPANPNIADLLKPLRQHGWYWDTETGKFTSGTTHIDDSLPWITQNLDFDCYLWNSIFFKTVAKQKMVHTHCQTCFKVVVAPRTFTELLRLEEYQQDCGLRCKCGIETREYVGRAYGGYFYSWEPGELEFQAYEEEGGGLAGQYLVVNDTEALRKGRLKYDRIVKDMAEHVQIGDTPVPVILKRGCTEFERDCGPTDQPRYRHISDEQIALEACVDEHVEYEHCKFTSTQPEAVKDGIRRTWADFAHFIGDMTYVPWLGRSLSVPPVTYHEGYHEAE